MGAPEKAAPEEILREESSMTQISLTHSSTSLALHTLLRDSHSHRQCVPTVAALHPCPMNVCTHFKYKEIGRKLSRTLQGAWGKKSDAHNWSCPLQSESGMAGCVCGG